MITRAQIRRQLRKNGGIMNAVLRQGYGIGDFVRKLIPKEIAKVSQVAAPFVAPFNPLAGAAMAGLGGFKQTGNLGRSLGAAALTGGLGAGARYLGGAKQILPGIGGVSSPLSVGKTASLFGTPGHMSRNTGWMKGTEGFLDKLGLTKGGGSMKMTPLGMISGASLLTYFMQKGATEEEAEDTRRFLLECQDIIHSVEMYFFVLYKNAPVLKNSEGCDIEIKDNPEHDLALDFYYTPESGQTIEQAMKRYESFYQKDFDPWALRINAREHVFLYITHHGNNDLPQLYVKNNLEHEALLEPEVMM